MALPEDDLSASSALIIESNPTSRSILVAQLRDFGMGTVVQCARLADARRQLEFRTFDVVLCEHHFANEVMSGQDLLDDLRRNQLLPFSTVFIMVTAEATYAKVAEAAESALDGYLLKPHKAVHLGERLRQARIRKISLAEIFAAIEAEDFDTAANLCLHRFETRGLFWLYAARVGAELLLRTGKCAQAQVLYEAVVAAKTLPWAKLGVARSLLDEGQTAKAASTLENLISEDPSYADAYDVMGRAQFELGKFDKALATYKMASELTPASISRLQNLGMMTYYAGDRKEAEAILDRTTRLGLDSKMFDCQTLVLLAFARLESGDRKGLQRCRDDFVRLIERNPKSVRHQRLAGIVDALSSIQLHQFAQALDAVRAMTKAVTSPDFDFEAASNLLALMAQLANKAIQLNEVEAVVDTLGMRFCISRPLSELLAAAAAVHEPYATRVREAHTQILKLAEHAMLLSMEGDPKAAVKNLIFHGNATLNGKLIETAYLVLHRYSEKISDAAALTEIVQDLRSRFCTLNSKPALGEQKRQAGGLTLRTGGAPAKVPTTLS
ncbi:response regulator [Rhodoferax ferrireducens]|uniref:response regulator n=1 Tax=Rhodoferax ferrireducens TaxID=192843 RepID=UPI000E0DF1B6|nr:response regulator [Rhodoferax ferrireducens]